MSPRILILNTYYAEFLDELYATHTGLAEATFEGQREQVLATAFCVADAYSHELRQAGCEAEDVIVNADLMQARWAMENGVSPTGDLHERRRQIVAAQVERYRPDVLFVFEWCPLGDAFLAEIKPLARLLVGQIASPLPANRTFAAYDLMVSSYPPIVDHFRGEGIDAEPFRLGFDARVVERLTFRPPRYDVTFVGGFAPSHPDRIEWLERILEHVDVTIFGYGVENVPKDSSVLRHHRGPVWGWRMYEVLQQSRITLNRHARIDIRGSLVSDYANNMRLYEATGVGTCLITESRNNLPDLFEPGREVLTYDDGGECIEAIRHYLPREHERLAIAQAGQARTLRNHTYADRMKQLRGLLEKRL